MRAVPSLPSLVRRLERHRALVTLLLSALVLVILHGRPLAEHVRLTASGWAFADDVRVLIYPLFRHEDAALFAKDPVVEYYLAVGEGALVGVRDRPMALKRFVDGADGEAFFQKRAPKSVPAFVRTVELSFPSGRTADEIVDYAAKNVGKGFGRSGEPEDVMAVLEAIFTGGVAGDAVKLLFEKEIERSVQRVLKLGGR